MSSPKIAWDEFSTWTNILMACRFRLNLPIFSSRFWANQRGLCARRFPEISVWRCGMILLPSMTWHVCHSVTVSIQKWGNIPKKTAVPYNFWMNKIIQLTYFFKGKQPSWHPIRLNILLPKFPGWLGVQVRGWPTPWGLQYSWFVGWRTTTFEHRSRHPGFEGRLRRRGYNGGWGGLAWMKTCYHGIPMILRKMFGRLKSYFSHANL